MFASCFQIGQNNAANWNWNTNGVGSMSELFLSATNFNQDISSWDVSNVMRMESMFKDAQSFNQNISTWDTSDATHMDNMFNGATAFDQSLGNWDISSIVNMSGMFQNTQLSKVNYDATLIGWHTDSSGVANDNVDDVPSNITFSGGNSQYCASETQRTDLLNTYNWTITDGDTGCNASDYFITTWTVAENETITIPTNTDNGEFYTYDVDWSYDGTTFNVESAGITGDATSPVLTAGTYTIAIRGIFPRIYFYTALDRDKIQTIEQWGNIEWTSMYRAFMGCSNLTITNPSIDAPNLSNVTDMAQMFRQASSFNGAINNWDVSTITNMGSMFADASVFNQPLNNWDVSNVENLSWMFVDATAFNQPLNGWNVDNVTNMQGVFSGASVFNQPLNSWNVSSVENMRLMFSRASSFNQPLDSWDVSNVTLMEGMFRVTTMFNQPLNSWNVSSVTDMERMFQNATAFNQPLNGWNVSSVENMLQMFLDAIAFNQPLNNWNVNKVIDMGSLFSGALSFDQSLSTWDLSNTQYMADMFKDVTLSITNYDATLLGWNTDSSGVENDGIDDVPLNINFHGGNSQYCIAESARNSLDTTYNWTITDGGLGCTISLSPKIYLQGAALNPNTGEETVMRDDLREAGLIPTTSPYADNLICEATVFNITGTDAIVDWIWVELRDETDNTVIINSQSALLQRDGDIVSGDGVSPLEFTQDAGSYYIVINHRNHLGIMSANSIALSNTVTTVDFTNTASQITYGSNAQTISGMPTNTVAMWCGDANEDTVIQYLGITPDAPTILSTILNDVGNFLNFPTYAVSGYNNHDINMDGSTQYSGTNPDTPFILQNALAHPGNFLNFSTYQITEQLPENE